MFAATHPPMIRPDVVRAIQCPRFVTGSLPVELEPWPLVPRVGLTGRMKHVRILGTTLAKTPDMWAVAWRGGFVFLTTFEPCESPAYKVRRLGNRFLWSTI
jgi:hypothetical protein